MAFEMAKQEARRLLSALEDGRVDVSDTFDMVEDADPTLVYFLLAWLRAWYPPSHPAAEAVLGRMGNLLSGYPKAAQIAREGGRDPLVAWFEDTYEYRDMQAAEFVDLVVEKLEG